MCGIAGFASIDGQAKLSEDDVHAMLRFLAHRGPDGSGVHSEAGVVLGHTRLSIIDLAGGAQPLCNETGTVWVSFNGEIFNYIELRESLLAAGHRFRTQSDTEVLVHAYEEYGDGFVSRLNGQFSFALWDGTRKRLLLVRDRVGILPLFYTVLAGKLFFASEIKALLPHLPAAPTMDLAALDQLFTFWVPISPRTLFKGIQEVPPGRMVVLEAGGIREQTYWDWNYLEDHAPPGEDEVGKAEELFALLADATRIRLRADVPVGAYLSGGLDSSALVALIRRDSTAKLKTFSLGFADQALDEGPYQAQLVDFLGVDHHRTVCTDAHIGADFLDTIFATEMPVLRTAPVPMRRLSALVRSQGYKVVLTGEGSDEVLGGYDIFKEAKIRGFWARFPQSERRPMLLRRLYPWLETSSRQGLSYLRNFYGVGLDKPDHPLFGHFPRMETTAQCKQFFSSAVQESLGERAEDVLTASLPSSIHRFHPFHRTQYVECKTLLPNYLLSAQGDRMLMANSVEGRFPFLDHRVIEFAEALPPRLKMRVLNEKYLLKRAMDGLLPPSILRRSKQPYRAPDVPPFFSAHPPDYVRTLLDGKAIASNGYFDAGKVDLLVRKAQAGRATSFRDSMALVGILSTQIWHHHFIERFSRFKA